jgi:hypothetical protein
MKIKDNETGKMWDSRKVRRVTMKVINMIGGPKSALVRKALDKMRRATGGCRQY